MHIHTFERIIKQVLNQNITDYGVGKKAAAFTGLSAGAISTIMRSGEIGPRSERAIVANYEAWLDMNPGMPNILEGADDEDVRPAFETVPLVRDTLNGRVIPSDKVNPALIGAAQQRVKGTDEEIVNRIDRRFKVTDQMIDGVVEGIVKALVVSGAPGVGKTFNIERRLKLYEKDFDLKVVRLKGGASPVGLYQALWATRKGGIILVDDCDSLFDDEQGLNLLKVSLDTTEERVVGWAKGATWVYNPDLVSPEEEQKALDRGLIPNSFVYEGQMIYITNRDFAALASANNKLADHYAALMSRSVYVDLTLHSLREKMVWMKHIYLSEMYQAKGIDRAAAEEILDFVSKHAARFHDLSLRMIGHLSDFRKIGPNWQELAEITKMK